MNEGYAVLGMMQAHGLGAARGLYPRAPFTFDLEPVEERLC